MQETESEFNYRGGPTQYNQPSTTASIQNEPQSEAFTWKASEFIDHQKSTLWFVALIGGAFILAVMVYVITRDVLSTLVILIAALAFGLYAGKKPRTLSYSLQPHLIKIDQKTYSYDDFRSFSVVQEGPLYSVVLEPVKRFMPPLTIYFDQSDGEKIFDTLSQHLPHEERGLDFVDKLMRKIRF